MHFLRGGLVTLCHYKNGGLASGGDAHRFYSVQCRFVRICDRAIVECDVVPRLYLPFGVGQRPRWPCMLAAAHCAVPSANVNISLYLLAYLRPSNHTLAITVNGTIVFTTSTTNSGIYDWKVCMQ